MDAIPHSYDECRFDAFCKSVLRNEAHNYRRGLKRQHDRQVSISALSTIVFSLASTPPWWEEYANHGGVPHVGSIS